MKKIKKIKMPSSHSMLELLKVHANMEKASPRPSAVKGVSTGKGAERSQAV